MNRRVAMAALALCGMAAVVSAESGVLAPSAAPTTTRGVVASAHPVASDAGIEILNAGGNAMDAAVAVAFTLAVVEPASSGLGGGGFVMWHGVDSPTSTFLDYRERAPGALPADAYLIDGAPDATTMRAGGASVATPGMVRGLLECQRAHGRLPLDRVLAPAVRAANDGFEVTPLFNEVLEDQLDLLLADKGAAAVFLADGLFPLEAGAVLKQPRLGDTIADIAAQGDGVVHGGEGAATIASATAARGGWLSEGDLADYATRTLPPIEIHYRGYTLHTAPPPSSGGIELALVLGALDRYDLSEFSPNDAEVLALTMALGSEAQRLVRETIADPATTPVDVAAMTNDAAVDRLIATVKWKKATAAPPSLEALPLDPKLREKSPGNTTHLTVIDGEGNAVSLTQTINYRFGSGVYVEPLGFFLNNEMYDFTFEAGSVNLPAAGKTPRSSMAPTVILRDGALVGVVGSPGGTRIPWAVARVITGMIDFHMSLDEAIAQPRFYVDSGKKEIAFEGRIDAAAIDRAADMLEGWGDHKRRALKDFDAYLGGVQACWIESGDDGTLVRTGGADPRRDGVVRVQP